MLEQIKKARYGFTEERCNIPPASIALTYDNGVSFLEERLRDEVPGSCNDIQQILIRGNREEITSYLNCSVLFGMKLTVVDVVLSRDSVLLEELVPKYEKLADEKMKLTDRIVMLVSENRKLSERVEELGRVTWTQVNNNDYVTGKIVELNQRVFALGELNLLLMKELVEKYDE